MVLYELIPIGVVHSPFTSRSTAPRQGREAGAIAEIHVFEAFQKGLDDLSGHRHLIVLSWFDRSDRTVLKATPPHTGVEHGVFATRSPDRPNPVGICVTDLLGIKGGVVTVRGLDALDGTPVIDIKPYIASIDCVKESADSPKPGDQGT